MSWNERNGGWTVNIVPLFTSDLRTQFEPGVLESLTIPPALLVALALVVAYFIVYRNRDRLEPAATDLVGDD